MTVHPHRLYESSQAIIKNTYGTFSCVRVIYPTTAGSLVFFLQLITTAITMIISAVQKWTQQLTRPQRCETQIWSPEKGIPLQLGHQTSRSPQCYVDKTRHSRPPRAVHCKMNNGNYCHFTLAFYFCSWKGRDSKQ
uniref:Uncharacterized protein n=1 Tax=Anguilla anguilla TaxID=7936 RepID=A0A0E9WUX4_ANGAN